MRINTNIAAMNTHRQLNLVNNQMQQSLERLSSGMRINRAADDAAGLAISEQMRGQISGLNQAQSNAQDATSLIQTAEGALNESHEILQRMRELAVQSANDTLTESDRSEIQEEVDQLALELTRISETTEFNTQALLDATFEAVFHIGANEGQNIEMGIDDMSAEALGVAGDDGGAEFSIGGSTPMVDADNVSGDALNVDAVDYMEEGENYEFDVVELDQNYMVSGEDSANYGMVNEDGDVVAISKEGQEWLFLEEPTAEGDLAEHASVADNLDGETSDYHLYFNDPVTTGSAEFETASVDDLDLDDDDNFAGETIIDPGSVTGHTLQEAQNLDTGTYTIRTAEDAITDALEEAGFDADEVDNFFGDGDDLGEHENIDGVLLDEDDNTAALGFKVITFNEDVDDLGDGDGDEPSFEAGDKIIANEDEIEGILGTIEGEDIDYSVDTQWFQREDIEDLAVEGLELADDAQEIVRLEDVVADQDNPVMTHNTLLEDADEHEDIEFGNFESYEYPKGIIDGTEVDIRAEGGIDVSTQGAADSAITIIDEAIEQVSSERSELGAVQNRLDHTVSNLGVASENLSAAESRIRDVDMAAEMMEFQRTQILSEAGTAMMAQANMMPQTVLQLLG